MAGGIRDGKGNILKNTDPLFTELSVNYPCDKYESFCNEFGVSHFRSEQIKNEKSGHIHVAIKQVLNTWVVTGKEVTREKLELALENAQTGGLVSIVKKHFAKNNAERDGLSEDAEKKHIGASSSTVDKIVYVTNNSTRKRCVDDSDGSLSKKTASQKAMDIPMTAIHREILRMSTPALLMDLDVELVLLDLSVKGFLDSIHKQSIEGNVTRESKVEALLEILPRCGDAAYSAFLQILAEKAKHLYAVVKSFEDELDSSSSEPTSCRAR